MATTYSKIQRSFWETDEAREMTPEEKYFWMYLQTNANVNTLGCYVFRMRKAQDETGYNRETIDKLLDKMVKTLRILYDKSTGEVFLLNSEENYWNKKTGTMRAILSDFKEIQSKMIKNSVETLLKKNGILEKETVKNTENTTIFDKEETERKQKGTEWNNVEQKGTNGNKLGEEEEEEEEEEKEKDKKEILSSDSEEFSIFWLQYPKKNNKNTAIRRWNRMKVTPDLYQKIMEGLKRAKNSQEWNKDGGAFIPYPSSWLNAGGWENEYRPLQPTEPPKPKPPTGGNDALDRRRQMMGG